ncbi:hypothetical protein [Jannaschia sp. W003]|uniref:hypothetical protein n=1 Tax=Jannaschia sp. W003 TaxID=2867012 RepID=UPI0021A3C1CE|nr:hypothetical protein [Jannaschia sp. W003]UWQ21382.1 hypothetical protein K3554_15650 [Jannaschia sp. W003]
MTRALLLAALLPASAVAQEFVPFRAVPDDEAFYRAVACAAPPGGECAKPFLHWPEARRAPLRVGLVSVTPILRGPDQRRFDEGLDAAIAQINGAGAGLRLLRDDVAPDVAIHVVPTPPDTVMEGIGVPGLDGELLQLGRVALASRGGEIQRGLIAISAHAPPPEVAPVLLEEVLQATGLMTDVRGPGLGRSVFSEDANAAEALSERDRMALRRHYPG